MRKIIWLILTLILITRIGIHYRLRPTFPNGTKIRITDRVVSEPVRYSNSQYLKLQNFKVYLPLYPEVYYGDRVVIEGLAEDGKLIKTRLLEVREGKGVLYGLRKRLIDHYQRSLPQAHASLVAGVTIGSKSDIPEELWNGLKNSGTAHVVVASGMNVSLVAGFLMGVLALYLPRRRAIPLAITGTWIYALMAGFDAPIIRAAIMGSVAFMAEMSGRSGTAVKLLILTAFVMLAVRPDWLTDLGFLLSFFATASLLLFEKRVYGKLKFVPEWLGVLKKDFSTSLAAQIGVAPILFVSFGQFNPLSPLINALVLWTIVPLTIIGMLGGVCGLIYEPIGTLILWLVYPLTSWFVWIVKHAG